MKNILLFSILTIFVGIHAQIILPDASFDHKYFDYFNQGINANFTTSQISNSFNFLYLLNNDFLSGLGLKFVNYGNVEYTTLIDTTKEPSAINYPYIYKTENLTKIGFNFFFRRETKIINFLFNMNFDYLNFSKNPIILTNSISLKKDLKDYHLVLTFYDLFPVQNFGQNYEYLWEPKFNIRFSKLLNKNESTLKLSFVIKCLTYIDNDYIFMYKNFSFSPCLELDYKYKNIGFILNTFSEQFVVSFLYGFTEKFTIFSSYGKNGSNFQYFSFGLNLKGANF